MTRRCALFALITGLVTCGGGNAGVATGDGSFVVPAVDAGCPELTRARPLCLRAAEGTCGSQQRECEAQCEPRLGPGSTEKDPALRSDIEADRCRQRCSAGFPACRSALTSRCPNACEPDAAAE